MLAQYSNFTGSKAAQSEFVDPVDFFESNLASDLFDLAYEIKKLESLSDSDDGSAIAMQQDKVVNLLKNVAVIYTDVVKEVLNLAA